MYRDPAHWPCFRVPAEQHPPEPEAPLADDLATDVSREVDHIRTCDDLLRAAHFRVIAREQRRTTDGAEVSPEPEREHVR